MNSTDHVTPISRGGDSSDGNVQLLAPICNLRNGAKTMQEYLAWEANSLPDEGRS